MFISGLNRFFEKHGRKTFAIFTGIIIVSFVLYFSPGFDITHLFNKRIPSDEEFGGLISKEDFNNAFNSNLILISLQLDGASLREQFVQQMAYYRALEWALAAKIAEINGFKASDRDVINYIKKQKVFNGKNGFDKNAYNLYVKNILEPLKFSELDLENAIRKDIELNRLRESVINSVIISEKEVEDEYNLLNTAFDSILFSFKNSDFIPESVSEEEVKAYFNANKEKYKIPPKHKAIAVRFNYIDFESEAEKNTSEKEIEEYYNSNKNEFTKDGKTEELSSVKEKIKDIIKKKKSTELAYQKAEKFSLDTDQKYMDQRAKPIKEIFFENAQEQKIQPIETDWFDTETKTIKYIGNEPDFVDSVADLILDQPLSEAIKGQRAAFVALLIGRQDSRQADFEEVKEKVTSDFKSIKAAKIANQKASEMAMAILEKLGEGAPIDKIDEFKSKFSSNIPSFSYEKPPEIPNSYEVLNLAAKTPAGKLSEIKELPSETIFIFVKAKKIPDKNTIDLDDFTKFKQQYKIRRQNSVWNSFLTSMIKKINKNTKK
ncbi:MAG TPA: peptidyl-prolyl cis-trans isomerase [Victivallales bacterium]|nr:peptidyl-prolyl cis-trans isomerase [Victivallales bacterium]HPO91783.1 peptidyl-prolyl cis-trans isomerase [Victivallales bacterium]HRR06777.1 peptidyl-prolyl cis-trans isomerase [Victivallales bacterium]HRR28011.1 peptidyl-prolyl cis-trans isomerase [Victivallales bacterium]